MSPSLAPPFKESDWAQSPADSNDELRDDAALDIEDLFRRKLAALRRLKFWERPHAFRAAREERLRALKALRDRRAWARQARHLLRRASAPRPR